jgi:parvulin-like peptidyl-prolyl isomerase
MLTWIREKFGKVVIGGIVAILAAVFVFYGVFSPKNTRGMGEGAVAGTVNGDSISLAEFNRAYTRQLEFFKNMLGGAKISEDQLKNFHIRESVFQELARRKIMIQQAEKLGYVPSDEEIREKILEIPAFQKDGKFDLAQYKQVLDANSYSVASFEKSLRDDVAVEKWQDYFRNRVNVSEGEIKQQFMSSEDKRDIKFVLITSDAGKKDLKVAPEEVQKFLADPAKLNLAKSQFESRKNTEYKGKTFDAVKDEIAHDVITSSQQSEIAKANQALAEKVMAVFTADKGSDAKVDQILKPYGVQVKNTGMVGRDTQYVPGLGEARDLLADAFAEKSPIDPAQGGKVKKYDMPGRVLIAVVSGNQKPDLAKLATQHDQVAREIVAKKERSLFEAWLKAQTDKAKIDVNPAVMGGAGEDS